MDPEEQSYTELLSSDSQGSRTTRRTNSFIASGLLICSIIWIFSLVQQEHQQPHVSLLPVDSLPSQRTAFHFQPRSNWMNDPNGPLYYNGYYHLFYQYNPYGALWGNIAWGHAISRDLIHWEHMDLAMHPDQWYDQQGVWSGSATILPDDRIIMLYTGSTNDSVQVQNMAVPLNLSDPLLTQWFKAPLNPILTPPPGIGTKDFRDPTTAWLEPDGLWRIGIGARNGTTGLALIYKTRDFTTWELEDGYLHEVPGTGMWECLDFFPVSSSGSNGLDTSQLQNDLVKYVLKASLDDDKHDYYAVGVYSPGTHSWTPENALSDVGLALRYDYGKYYASKSFFDSSKNRRILWGWANESDSVQDDINKGWSSVQTLPRTLQLDMLTGNSLIQWPVEEVESLRHQKTTLSNLVLEGGDVVEVGQEPQGSQLDIEVEFEYPDASKLDPLPEAYDCSQGGSSHRGVFGPFGLLVLADETLRERTAVYFYMSLASSGVWETRVCSDQSRSSLETDLDTTVYGAGLRKLPDDDLLRLRVIVDHSVVETFAQGGRACITSRVYPTLALDSNARVFLFNNGTQAINLRNLNAWKMHSTKLTIIPPQTHQVL